MGNMHCPSDFRFGDDADPRSPYYDGGTAREKYVTVPYDFEDAEGVSRRLHVEVGYTEKSDGDEGLVVDEIWAHSFSLNGVAISQIDAYSLTGDAMDDDCLRALHSEVMASKLIRDLQVSGVGADGRELSGRLRVSFSAFPSAPDTDGPQAQDIQNISTIGYLYTEQGAVKLQDFTRFNPETCLDSPDFLRSVLFDHVINSSANSAPEKKRSAAFRP
jgi:hypothetical protein